MRFLAFIGLLAIIAAVALAGYFFGGFYDVAATAEDPAPVASALIRVRTAAIARRAHDRAPPGFDDLATVQNGARQYVKQGCSNCHGAPGVEWAKFSEGLNPGPPDLKEIANEREPEALFWVVKNGIRMTGMPSFGKAGVADSEIWQIVAFVKKLPGVSEADYKSWTAAAQ